MYVATLVFINYENLQTWNDNNDCRLDNAEQNSRYIYIHELNTIFCVKLENTKYAAMSMDIY